MRIEVEGKEVSGSFAIVHVGHKKALLAPFGKTRKAFRDPDNRLATPLQASHPPAKDAPKHRRREGLEPDLERRSRKQRVLGLNAGLGVGLECGEQFTRGYFVHLIAA
ncbi:hypothetical protein ACFS5L_44370 [Streptomyces phyllanthi]|uniref:Uncharacterized protein n=1 Tax=Streptomyces phyllanthi TaxID=1803180 RepID=A0A5N8W5W3_9ACTN|nr:hypothetical protein [Streptomyces phyllanthi]MPY42502.1 hypothetical protein [Streptomyces phyllanthi]